MRRIKTERRKRRKTDLMKLIKAEEDLELRREILVAGVSKLMRQCNSAIQDELGRGVVLNTLLTIRWKIDELTLSRSTVTRALPRLIGLWEPACVARKRPTLAECSVLAPLRLDYTIPPVPRFRVAFQRRQSALAVRLAQGRTRALSRAVSVVIARWLVQLDGSRAVPSWWEIL